MSLKPEPSNLRTQMECFTWNYIGDAVLPESYNICKFPAEAAPWHGGFLEFLENGCISGIILQDMRVIRDYGGPYCIYIYIHYLDNPPHSEVAGTSPLQLASQQASQQASASADLPG